MNAVQRPVNKSRLRSHVESTSLAVPQVNDDKCSVISSTVHSASEQLPDTYKNHFFSGLGLTAARSTVSHTSSEVIECNVIVIDDDEDDVQIPHRQDCCMADLFGTTRSLRSDVEANGNATSRLAQPWSRLRKLLSIDISSPLGSRTLKYVTSTLRNDVMPLNPYTVSHSLAGSDNALDYGTFCRTPVKGKFSGRLRHREFPVKFRHSSAGSHYHYYCFGRADRRRFCRRFDTGLSGRSRRLRRMYNRCSVVMLQLTADEISDWRSSQRLRDYVKRMEEKEKRAAVGSSSHNNAVHEVICLSSDSEDELSSPVKKQNDLMFRCHQCDLQLPCDASFRTLIRKHYRACHDITDIDIVDMPQSDGSLTMQVIHVTPTATQMSAVAPNSLTVSQSTSVTGLEPALQHGSSLYLLQPRPCQSHTSAVSHSVPAQSVRGTWPSCNSAADQMQANTDTNAPTQLHNLTLTQLKHVQSCEMSSAPLPLPRQLLSSSVLVNGSMMCQEDAVNKLAASSLPSCDADVIYLD